MNDKLLKYLKENGLTDYDIKELLINIDESMDKIASYLENDNRNTLIDFIESYNDLDLLDTPIDGYFTKSNYELFTEAIKPNDNKIEYTKSGNARVKDKATIIMKDDSISFISTAHDITDIERFAGRDARWKVDNEGAIKELLRYYDGSINSIYHVEGIGHVFPTSTDLYSKKAIIHWWDCGQSFGIDRRFKDWK